jgi:hypothetical protein
MSMPDRDESRRDAAIQLMRKVFAVMEQAQQEFLGELDIAPADPRLRRWREQALALFERCWGIVSQMGIAMDAVKASVVYCAMLVRIMNAEGIGAEVGCPGMARMLRDI